MEGGRGGRLYIPLAKLLVHTECGMTPCLSWDVEVVRNGRNVWCNLEASPTITNLTPANTDLLEQEATFFLHLYKPTS